MIRAALDCRSGFPALVIADERRVTFTGSLELGTVVDSGAKKIREITPEQIATCVEKISDACCMVERAVLLVAGARSEAFCVALEARLVNDGITVEKISVAPRKLNRESIVKHLTNWPEAGTQNESPKGWRTGDYGGTRSAAHALLTDLGISEAPVKGASVKTLKQQDRGEPVREVVASLKGVVGSNYAVTGAAESVTPSAGERENPAIQRVLAIDTGANVGVVVAEKLGPMWRQLLARTIAVKSADPEERADFIEGVAGIIVGYQVTRVVIERVTHMHGGHVGEVDAGKAIGALRAMGTALVAANWLGGMVEGACLSAPRPPEVATAPAAQWRRRVCGGKTTPDDDAVRDRVKAAFPVWPAESTTHERDAAGLILWDELASAPVPEKAPRPRGMSPSKPRRKEGCTCPAGKKGAHLKECPARAPRKAGGVQMCKVCGLPRKGHVCSGERAGEKSTEEEKKEGANA